METSPNLQHHTQTVLTLLHLQENIVSQNWYYYRRRKNCSETLRWSIFSGTFLVCCIEKGFIAIMTKRGSRSIVIAWPWTCWTHNWPAQCYTHLNGHSSCILIIMFFCVYGTQIVNPWSGHRTWRAQRVKAHPHLWPLHCPKVRHNCPEMTKTQTFHKDKHTHTQSHTHVGITWGSWCNP